MKDERQSGDTSFGESGDGDSISHKAFARSLLDLGACLYECRDIDKALHDILRQARSFAHAEAGSLYLLQQNDLEFVAAQNDKLGRDDISYHLLGKKLPVNNDSLVGYVANTRRHVNVPDARSVSNESPFRINRDLEAATGYEIHSILAIPLNCPREGCIGVMELFNRLDPRGEAAAFSEEISDGIIMLAAQAAMILHNLRLQEQLRQVHLHSIFRLAGIAEYRDADTGDHIRRVSHISEMLAAAVGMSHEQVELIKYASSMHDVGKVAIPDAILLKRGYLTPQQRKVMEQHTIIGAQILGDPEDEVLSMAREVALRHHERWDGRGYPEGLSGDEIPLCGRIVALADVFDAIVSKRCYKDACPLDVALDIVQNDSGHHFDPLLVSTFINRLDDILEPYPALKAA